MIEQVRNNLLKFDPISLEEMDRVALMKRTDTKFAMHILDLKDILQSISKEYKILTVEDVVLQQYESVYYDTEDLQAYFDHHNSRSGRTKIRKRSYLDSDLNFLEIKTKNQKGRTIKKRIIIDQIEETIDARELEFIEKEIDQLSDLRVTLKNKFRRFTLVHKTRNERITGDIMIEIDAYDQKEQFNEMVIMEVKQEKFNRNNLLFKELKNRRIQPSSMSKYCLGIALLNPEVKSNKFKQSILQIEKLQSNE